MESKQGHEHGEVPPTGQRDPAAIEMEVEVLREDVEHLVRELERRYDERLALPRGLSRGALIAGRRAVVAGRQHPALFIVAAAGAGVAVYALLRLRESRRHRGWRYGHVTGFLSVVPALFVRIFGSPASHGSQRGRDRLDGWETRGREGRWRR